MSSIEDLEKMFDHMKAVMELKEKLKEKMGEDRCDCDEDEKCEYMVALSNEFNEFLKWAFDASENLKINKKTAKKMWKNAHPELSIPRVFLTDEDLPNYEFVISLMIDAYPLYLKAKKC